MIIVVVAGLALCQGTLQNLDLNVLRPTEIRVIPSERLSSSKERRNGSTSPLITENGEKLYYGVSTRSLVDVDIRLRQIFESALVPGMPLVGSWQKEFDDGHWTGEHKWGLNNLAGIFVLDEYGPNSIIVAHNTERPYPGADRQALAYSAGISSVDLASSTATQNRVLLRLPFDMGSASLDSMNEIFGVWRDIGSSRTLIYLRKGAYFFFDGGKIEPVSKIPGTTTPEDILCVCTKAGVLVTGSTYNQGKQVFVTVQSFYPGRGYPYLEKNLPTDVESYYYRLQATVLPGTRILLTMSPWLEKEELQSKAYVIDYVNNGVKEVGPYAILATSRSGKWVLLGSASWSDPAYLLKF